MKKDYNHILYHLVIRRCGLEQFTDRKKQLQDLGAFFVASFFEKTDSTDPYEHIHSLVRLDCAHKTFSNKYSKKYKDDVDVEKCLYSLSQIKPPTLDPTHLDNVLNYISKDGHKIEDDGSIDWDKYIGQRIRNRIAQTSTTKSTKKSLKTFTSYLVGEFKKELDDNPDKYKNIFTTSNWGPTIERNVMEWIESKFVDGVKIHDDFILIRFYHLLNATFKLGGKNSVDMAMERLFK